jgi:hypothetical protein
MMTFCFVFNTMLDLLNVIPSRPFSILSVALLVCIKRMSTEKEVERDADGVEVGGDDGFVAGFKDDIDLGTKDDTQLGIIHVLELALMTLLKKS